MSRREWFDEPRNKSRNKPSGKSGDDQDTQSEAGLRFECTMCGNCCTGPTGYVLFTEREADAIAKRLGVSHETFDERYARETIVGKSLREVKTSFGYDCVFLDRETIPGKAVCSLYEDRPEQCRTWPFWKSNLNSEYDWNAAAQGCPGIGSGPSYDPAYIRLTRDRIDV